MKRVWYFTKNFESHSKKDIALITECIDLANGLVPQGIISYLDFDELEINPKYVKIDEVNNEFVVIEDTAKKDAYQVSLVKSKLKKKKVFAEEVIIHINSIIDNWSPTDKLTLLARSDIKNVLTFLNYGSIDQTKILCENLDVDSLLTNEIKNNVINFLTEKINEFNAIDWS